MYKNVKALHNSWLIERDHVSSIYTWFYEAEETEKNH